MIVIGITGTLGAGKGTVVEYLVNKYGFKHYSARDFILEEVNKRGLPPNRDSTTPVANELREKFGSGYIIEELYKRAEKEGVDAVIESIRNPGEVESLKNLSKFHLIAVDADIGIRYERITERKSTTDSVTFEKFIADEEREMHSTDPHKQNIRACIEEAEFVMVNNGTKDELEAQVDEIMNKLK